LTGFDGALPKADLEILIPSYNRPSVQNSLKSVLDQIHDSDIARRIAVHVCDDAGDRYNILDWAARQPNVSANLKVTRNVSNLGMSANLRAMVESSESDYVLILTDDDLLEPDAVSRCLDLISRFSGTAAFLFPRHGWNDDEELQVVDCVVSRRRRKWIGGNPVDSVRYARHGFILSGLLVQKSAFDLDTWDQVADNAFFPVALIGNLLMSERILFVNHRVVRHRVFNETFWHRWGHDEASINARLYNDYVTVFLDLYEAATQDKHPIMRARIGFFLWWNLTRERVSWDILRKAPFPPPMVSSGGETVMIIFHLTEKVIACLKLPIIAVFRLKALAWKSIARVAQKGRP